MGRGGQGRDIADVSRRLLAGLAGAVLAVTLLVRPVLAQEAEVLPELERLFAEAGTAGTLAVHIHGSNRLVVSNKVRAETPYSPSSTFKIPATLLALRLGVVSGLDESFAPPERPFLVRGKPFLPPACEGRVTLKTALHTSCIPVYQDIAGRIGVARYNDFLGRMNYGPPVVTDANLRKFWLTGALKVSAREQVAFLDRLAAGRLPFQAGHVEAVEKALTAGESEKGTIFAKTGWVFTSTPEVGWYVGWVAKDGNVTATFALNLDLLAPEHGRARREIALKALRMLDLW